MVGPNHLNTLPDQLNSLPDALKAFPIHLRSRRDRLKAFSTSVERSPESYEKDPASVEGAHGRFVRCSQSVERLPGAFGQVIFPGEHLTPAFQRGPGTLAGGASLLGGWHLFDAEFHPGVNGDAPNTPFRSAGNGLADQFTDHIPVDVREPEVPSRGAEGELFMVEAE